MATNEHFRDADNLSLPVPDGTVSGDPVAVGALVGVALTDAGDGGNPEGSATVRRKGAFRLPVTGSLDIGEPVYITSAGALTATEGENTLFGYALADKPSGPGTIPVAIAQV